MLSQIGAMLKNKEAITQRPGVFSMISVRLVLFHAGLFSSKLTLEVFP